VLEEAFARADKNGTRGAFGRIVEERSYFSSDLNHLSIKGHAKAAAVAWAALQRAARQSWTRSQYVLLGRLERDRGRERLSDQPGVAEWVVYSGRRALRHNEVENICQGVDSLALPAPLTGERWQLRAFEQHSCHPGAFRPS
jgi:hypothetical protein